MFERERLFESFLIADLLLCKMIVAIVNDKFHSSLIRQIIKDLLRLNFYKK
jgi:hypothetical protein